MDKNPITPAEPDPARLRALVGERLGVDPIAYVRALRCSTTPPMSWNRIAQEIQNETGLYITQEAPRRWIRKDDARLAAEQGEQAAA
jgi:hypothetical protein